MEVKINCKIGARFKLVTRKAKTNIVSKETEWFENLVLDSGLNRMSTGTWIDRCVVGTGNSNPIASQSSLDNFTASTTTIQSDNTQVSNITTAPYYFGSKRTWRFGEGVAAGNISEVGMGWANAQLWNRALIKDINGNPTTITVLSDEYLDVIVEVRVYLPTTVSGSFNLLDKVGNVISSHTYTGTPYFSDAKFEGTQVLLGNHNIFKPCSVYTGDVGASLSTEPTGAKLLFTATNSYPTPRSVRAIASLDLNDANFAHKSFLIKFAGLMTQSTFNNGFKVQINPTITKNNAQKMSYTFEMSWDRYTT